MRILVCTVLVCVLSAEALPQQGKPGPSAPSSNRVPEIGPPETEYYDRHPPSNDPEYRHGARHATKYEEVPKESFGQRIRHYIYVTTEYLRPLFKCLSPLVPPVVVNLN